MEALYVLLVFSLLLGVGFLLAFFWAHTNGQFEDTETPALRMLFDNVGPSSHKPQRDTHNTGGVNQSMQLSQNEKIGGT